MIEMQPLTQRLRETLAERYYRGEITSSALTEQLNLSGKRLPTRSNGLRYAEKETRQ